MRKVFLVKFAHSCAISGLDLMFFKNLQNLDGRPVMYHQKDVALGTADFADQLLLRNVFAYPPRLKEQHCRILWPV